MGSCGHALWAEPGMRGGGQITLVKSCSDIAVKGEETTEDKRC